MKKFSIVLLILCLLCGNLCIPISAAPVATDELASNYIPAETETKLKEQTPYDQVIKLYTIPSYFDYFAEGMNLEEVIKTTNKRLQYVTIGPRNQYGKEVQFYYYEGAELKYLDDTMNMYGDLGEWVRENLPQNYLQIEGKGAKEVSNVYFLYMWDIPGISTIVYDTGDAYYYAVFNRADEGTKKLLPTYYAEEDFYAYVKAVVSVLNGGPAYDENGNPLYGGTGPFPDALHFNPLEVTLTETPLPNWLLYGGIALGVVVLAGGVTAIIVVRKRKCRATAEATAE